MEGRLSCTRLAAVRCQHPDRLDMDLAPHADQRQHTRDCAACDMAGHDLVHADQPRLGRSPSLGHWHRRVEERRDYRKQQIGAVHNRHVRSAGEHREL
jgi:hypothetical protein